MEMLFSIGFLLLAIVIFPSLQDDSIHWFDPGVITTGDVYRFMGKVQDATGEEDDDFFAISIIQSIDDSKDFPFYVKQLIGGDKSDLTDSIKKNGSWQNILRLSVPDNWIGNTTVEVFRRSKNHKEGVRMMKRLSQCVRDIHHVLEKENLVRIEKKVDKPEGNPFSLITNGWKNKDYLLVDGHIPLSAINSWLVIDFLNSKQQTIFHLRFTIHDSKALITASSDFESTIQSRVTTQVEGFKEGQLFSIRCHYSHHDDQGAFRIENNTWNFKFHAEVAKIRVTGGDIVFHAIERHNELTNY